PAVATLVEKGHSSSRSSSSNYWLKYAFNDERGVEHIRQAKVRWEDWRRFRDGDTLTIRYVRDNPERNRLAGGLDNAWWVLPLIFGNLGVVFGGLGWTFVVMSLRKVLAEMNLLRTGSVAEGKVIAFHSDPSITINGRHPAFFEYRFEAEGKTHQGRSPDLPLSLMERWNRGDAIRVVYDVRNPNRSEPDIYDVRTRG
ncbi:MAG TPA: DUF3592 domain-containing protein, partial [Chthoniobacterales bacterium]